MTDSLLIDEPEELSNNGTTGKFRMTVWDRMLDQAIDVDVTYDRKRKAFVQANATPGMSTGLLCELLCDREALAFAHEAVQAQFELNQEGN